MVRCGPAAVRALHGDARCVEFGPLGPFDAARRPLEVCPLAGVSSSAMGCWLGGEGLVVLVVGVWLPWKWRTFDFEIW